MPAALGAACPAANTSPALRASTYSRGAPAPANNAPEVVAKEVGWEGGREEEEKEEEEE